EPSPPVEESPAVAPAAPAAAASPAAAPGASAPAPQPVGVPAAPAAAPAASAETPAPSATAEPAEPVVAADGLVMTRSRPRSAASQPSASHAQPVIEPRSLHARVVTPLGHVRLQVRKT